MTGWVGVHMGILMTEPGTKRVKFLYQKSSQKAKLINPTRSSSPERNLKKVLFVRPKTYSSEFVNETEAFFDIKLRSLNLTKKSYAKKWFQISERRLFWITN